MALKLVKKVLVQHSSNLANGIVQDRAPGLVVEAAELLPANGSSNGRIQYDACMPTMLKLSLIHI